MKLFLSLAALLSALYTLAQIPVYNPSNGHYYQRKNAICSWQHAKEVAEQYEYQGLGGHLVTIKDAQEEQFVYDLLEGQEGYWLGGYQDRNSPQYAEPYGAWKWVTGEPWNSTSWCIEEPDDTYALGVQEDCLITWWSRANNLWGWNDYPNSAPGSLEAVQGFVVEYEPSSLSGWVNFRDYNGDVSSLSVQLDLYDVSGNYQETKIALPSSDGHYEVYVHFFGDGYVRASSTGFLSRKKNLSLMRGMNSANFDLINGDINQDNKIDDFDLASVIFDFGQSGTSSGDNTDINHDGITNDFDLSLVIFSFGKKGE